MLCGTTGCLNPADLATACNKEKGLVDNNIDCKVVTRERNSIYMHYT